MSFLVTENSSIHSVNANEVVNSNDSSQTSNIVISSEKISPYVIEFVTQQETNNIASYARSLSSHNDENYTTVRVDFSQAEFYDNNGNLLDKDTIMETIRPEKLLARFVGTSGGTGSSGSGYSVCKGMFVSGNAGLGLPSGTSTKHLYFRVGNDTFWLDTNF